MTQFAQLQPQHSSASPALEFQANELTHLLLRLQQTTLHPDPERERRLRTSEYERVKLASNLDYARSLLTRLEQEALSLKAISRRSELQANLHHRKEQLDQLFDRLADLRKIAENADSDEEGDDTDGEDLLGQIGINTSSLAPSATGDVPPIETHPIQEHSQAASSSHEPQPQPSEPPAQPMSNSLPTETNNTLRERRPQPASTANPQAASTTSAIPSNDTTDTPTYASARAALFANRRNNSPGASASTTGTSTVTAEAILDSQRNEQDALSDSILKMASALKAGSQKFSSTLEADKDVLGRAGDGMEKTERGMEAAKGRMGLLRRMTEGKGWWGRMILYAWVYGLMVALILLVFAMPKLRLR